MRILLVDDSPSHREAGINDLEALGHEVVALDSYETVLKTADLGERFDVALLDLLMPAEAMMLGGDGLGHLGESFAIGYPLSAYLALKGVGLIAVATDTNHHSHPASAFMDWVACEPLEINSARVLWMHAPMKEVDGKWEKDWVKAFERLIQE